jgi:multiple sugar transport system permease protein
LVWAIRASGAVETMLVRALIDRLRDPSEKTLGVLLLAPAFLLLALIVVYPIGKLVFNSFFDLRLSGGGAAKFVGFENYVLVSRTSISGTRPRTPC